MRRAVLGVLLAASGCASAEPSGVVAASATTLEPAAAVPSGPAAQALPEPSAGRTASPQVSASASPATSGASGDGRFELEGWVVEARVCAPCPPDALCKPCEPHIIVSRTAHPVDTKLTTEGNTRVDVMDAGKFPVGTKVRMLVVASARQPFVGDPCCTRVEPYVVRRIE